MSRDILLSEPRALATLMGSTDETLGRWQPEELKEILRHQLESPLLFDLQDVDAAGKFTLERWDCVVDGIALHSFGDLFKHPHPPISLLRLTKEFAKSSDTRKASALPPEVATVLYYAAILVARMRCGEKISTLDDKTLRDATDWTLRQPWLEEVMRT